jgi:hypothetical protein
LIDSDCNRVVVDIEDATATIDNATNYSGNFWHAFDYCGNGALDINNIKIVNKIVSEEPDLPDCGISGQVRDALNASIVLENVAVSVRSDGSVDSGNTDAGGNYSLKNVVSGNRQLDGYKAGYCNLNDSIVVTPTSFEFNHVMTSRPLEGFIEVHTKLGVRTLRLGFICIRLFGRKGGKRVLQLQISFLRWPVR